MHYLEEICIDYKNGMSFEKICKKYGGISLYVPKVIPNAKEKIIQEFNGANFATLAYKYNLSEITIRDIIKKSREGKREATLF
ncbi:MULTISPECIES: Mor transcription activator family protein [Helicobacter]|uniref:Mor transcription activator domain-containing protein n=2 Tax=Helicobacter TaxID=209 RepID=C3XGT4_9HELI|nr:MULTISPECIES: Mor transcription activator family protein [Helicobacter]EEO24223.1 hypothetical protein HRAG_01280 [Helicobacter bilis ATCC 43879]TLD81316.1 hypothetical protein LS81_008745 [Helicobacter trogontum]